MDEWSAFRTVDLPIPLLTLGRALIEQSRNDQARILNPTSLERSPPSHKYLRVSAPGRTNYPPRIP